MAGSGGLGRFVKNATLMEVPDIIPYVEENTLLLTTLYPIADDKVKIEALIPQLNSKNVAGICIKPLRYIENIPQVMLDQADACDFPIIELPADANLSTLVNLILSVTLNDQVAQMQFRDNIHRSLMKLLLAGASVDALVMKLAEILNRDVVLLDKKHSCTCLVSKGENGEWKSVKEPHKKEELYLNPRCITYSIKAGSSLFGYIHLPNSDKTDENLQTAVEQAAMLFASIFFKSDVALLQQKNFRDVFVRDLLQGKIRSETEFENKLEAFDITLNFPQTVVVVQMLSSDEIRKRKFYNRLTLEKPLGHQIGPSGVPDNIKNIVYYNDALVILEPSMPDEDMIEYYENFKNDLMSKKNYKAKIGIAISEQAGNYLAIQQSYRQAATIVNIGNTLYQDSFVSTYAQNRLMEIIEKVSDTDLLIDLVRDKLGAILDYDQENATNLMETLHILIQYNFNFKKAAESAYVHYNTIRYRANKIMQLGISFDQGHNLAEIIIAYDTYLWLKATNKI